MPAVEIDVDPDLVRRLLSVQFAPIDAETATAPLTFLAQGWDNAMYRLGDHHVVRLPVRSMAAPLIDKEATWLPVITAGLPVDCPVPIFTGVPQDKFPWKWTIGPWIEGTVVDELAVSDRDLLANDLAETLIKLHRPAPDDAPINPVRGVPLRQRATSVDARWPVIIEHYGEDVTARLRDVWAEGLSAPEWPGPPVWVHGDPHPFNLLQRGGRLSGMIDFGDLGAGDPASDLATAWLTLDEAQREQFRRLIDAYGAMDPHIWRRSAAWAVVMFSALAIDPGSRGPFGNILAHTVRQLTQPLAR